MPNGRRDFEHKVHERTEELNQRVAELAIINSVQEGLASKLDIQGIYDLVGDKLYRDLPNGYSLISPYIIRRKIALPSRMGALRR